MQTTKIAPCGKCSGTIGVWKLKISDEATEIFTTLVCYRCLQPAEAHVPPKKQQERRKAFLDRLATDK